MKVHINTDSRATLFRFKCSHTAGGFVSRTVVRCIPGPSMCETAIWAVPRQAAVLRIATPYNELREHDCREFV